MLCPVRCFTCGKVIIQPIYDEFQRRSETEDSGKVLSDLGIKRYCCRTVVMTSIDFSSKLMIYCKIKE